MIKKYHLDLLIGLLLIFRYGLKLGLLVITPPVIAACVGLAVTSAVGIPITIFNLLALILILAIGIDYTLFFAEQKQKVKTIQVSISYRKMFDYIVPWLDSF